jgi:UDP-glucose 4-epimerase
VPAFLERELGERVFVEQLDLADAEHLLTLGKRYPIRGIVHLAAAPFAGDEPLVYLRRSLDTLFSVLDAARRWEVDRVCLASTIGVYAGAGAQPGPVNEDLPVPLLAGAALSDPDDQAPVSSSRSLASRWVR